MKLDFVAKKKNTITVSDSSGSTVSGLNDVHTAKTTFAWGIPEDVSGNPPYAVITLNVYDVEIVDTIDLTYTGELTSMSIDRSIDGFNWDSLSIAFLPADTTIEIDYTSQTFRDFKFLRMTINDPVSFVLTEWKVNREVTYENTDLISHNLYNLYSANEIENFPIYPDFHKQILKMIEGNNDIDLKLFDASIFANSSIVAGTVGDILTLTPTNIPLITDTLYIWDFGDGLVSTSNPSIIVTTNPLLAQTHDYAAASSSSYFVPRLIVQTRTYMIEYVTSFSKA